MIIPTPAPRPENEKLMPPSVMETDAMHEQTIVHMIVSIQVKAMVCHEILDLRISITALQKPIRTDKTTISPYGDLVKTGISICILEMVYAIYTAVAAIYCRSVHHKNAYDKSDN